ncbi:MAG: PqqD family protein [Thermoguttaceae bacterium]|nr:PqqD family protein [Thermoguttaceae bacterium]
MKLSSGFVLRRVLDKAILVPFGGKLVDFNGMIKVNKVGAALVERLQNEATLEDLVDLVLERFDVDEQTANRDVQAFLEQLRRNGALIE